MRGLILAASFHSFENSLLRLPTTNGLPMRVRRSHGFGLSRVAMTAALLSTLTVGTIQAQVTLETTSQWSGNTAYAVFGVNSLSLFGQTFAAPAQYLNSWTFYLANSTNAADLMFTANLGTWTGGAVGSLLWTSDLIVGTSSPSFVPYVFQTGGVSLLTGGETYIFFLRAVSGSGSRIIGSLFEDGYAGQGLAFGSAADPFQHWSGALGIEGDDLAFEADFSRTPSETVPEPATMTLLATGLLGVTAARRKRQRA
jgi:hypothetical protein